MLIETPELDKISIKEWFTFDNYNFVQIKEINTLFNNEVWITKERIKIKVKDMKTSHIQNCIKCWNGEGKSIIPINYLGGKDKWLKIFNNELKRRN